MAVLGAGALDASAQHGPTVESSHTPTLEQEGSIGGWVALWR